MLIAISGYCASGKSTLLSALRDRLTKGECTVQWRRFDSLYLSSKLTRKPARKAAPKADGSLGLRRLEGERGEWDRRFGFKQLLDVAWASVAIVWLRWRHRRDILLLDRYFIDRFIHFNPDGVLYRIAASLAPAPDLLFILIPDRDEWEQRIVARIARRFDMQLSRLPEADQRELDFVRSRYARMAERCKPKAIVLDSRDEAVFERSLKIVREQLTQKKRKR